jgi:hypothetical protein
LFGGNAEEDSHRPDRAAAGDSCVADEPIVVSVSQVLDDGDESYVEAMVLHLASELARQGKMEIGEAFEAILESKDEGFGVQISHRTDAQHRLARGFRIDRVMDHEWLGRCSERGQHGVRA